MFAVELNVTVQLVTEFIRFCACEFIMCGITALEVEGRYELLATGMSFGVLFLSEMPTKANAGRLRLLHRSHLKTGYFCDQ